jgi:hypothetical protein
VPCGVLLFTAVLMYLELKQRKTEEACVSSHEEIHSCVCVCFVLLLLIEDAGGLILNEYINVAQHHLRTRSRQMQNFTSFNRSIHPRYSLAAGFLCLSIPQFSNERTNTLIY